MTVRAYTSALTRQILLAETEIKRLVFEERAPTVIVEAPPGAGKTALVASTVAEAVSRGQMVAVVTARAFQSYDVARRLVSTYPDMPVQILQASDRVTPSDLTGLINSGTLLSVTSDVRELSISSGVVVSTVSKMVVSSPDLRDELFDLIIADEAYQIDFRGLAPLFPLVGNLGTILLVGDNGQLAPLVMVDTVRLSGGSGSASSGAQVHWAAPRELLRQYPDLPVVRLPASRRLPRDCVPIIQQSFYPGLPFRATSNRAERRLGFSARSKGDLIDRALSLCAGGAALICIALPALARPSITVDEELCEFAASLVARILERGALWRGRRLLEPDDIACIDPVVRSGAAIRRYLQSKNLPTERILCDTPERIQGAERAVTIVRHPLSGSGPISGFGLDKSRFCVCLSRHTLACVIVTRGDVGDRLRQYRYGGGSDMLGGEDDEWSGWVAHRTVWDWLERKGRIIRL
jgi:superfamily I DNA and/or RNA helicase